ncbi:MAG: glycosyltransferase family 39 protein [Planctomycetes bacterium]|nr:glycosyltransferase family 39 protein [Planctomycetota bacterium]
MQIDSRATAASAAFLAPVLLLLPFVGKALHIDDPLFVWMARHIVEHPGDPYGLQVFWERATEPMYLANQNPPGIAYWLGLVGTAFGFGGVALHVSTALFAGAAGLGTYLLARELCQRPLTAALVAMLTPGMLVSASTLMTDVPMVALHVWSLALWIAGVNRDRRGLLVGAAVTMSAAFFFKYFALTLVPLALLYTVVVAPRRWRRAWPLVIPIVVAAAYVAWGLWRYDDNLLTVAADVALRSEWRAQRTVWQGCLVGLAFTGGCGASMLCMAPLLWSRRTLVAVTVGAAAVVGSVCLPTVFARLALPDTPTDLAYRLQAGIWIAAGLHIALLVFATVWQRRDAAAILLATWIVGTFVFSVFVNHLINARTLLPLLPALGVLAAQRMAAAGHRAFATPPWAVGALGVAGGFALWVAAADYEYADASRAAARAFARDRSRFAAEVYFFDHWGFQYYMQEHGARSLESGPNAYRAGSHRPPRSGDTGVIAHRHSSSIAGLDGCAVLAEYEYPMRTGMSTMTGGAGFYSHFLGMLPFVAGTPVPEAFRFVRIP